MNVPVDPVPFALPDITDAEISAVEEVLRSRWLTTGARAAELEQAFAAAVGAPFAVALNSCTAALHLSLEALGIGPGDLVFLPTYTFAATAEVVRYVGATPVLCDVEPGTLNLDVTDLETRIEAALRDGSARPAAVIPVHIAGVSCDMEAVWDLARRHGLSVIEDAAHAFPAQYKGNPVGWWPDDVQGTACYSFYATKTITTGEGGMVVTRDEAVSDRIRLMSLHGLSKQAWNRYSGGTWRYDIVAPGYKYNLSDIAAALGVVQLRRSGLMLERRREIAQLYAEQLGDLTALELPTVPEDRVSAWHLFIARTGTGAPEQTRDAVVEGLTRRGIGVSVHFIPLHLHSYYRDTFNLTPEDFPVADAEFRRAFSLPIWSAMTNDQVGRVAGEVRSVVEELM